MYQQHFSLEHDGICKKYCDYQTWHVLQPCDLVPMITGELPSINSATKGLPYITRLDQIPASVHPANSKFFSSKSLSTITPFTSRWLPKLSCSRITPLNILLSFIIHHFTKTICWKKNASRPFSTKYSIAQFIVFSNLEFSLESLLIVTKLPSTLHLCQSENLMRIQVESATVPNERI